MLCTRFWSQTTLFQADFAGHFGCLLYLSLWDLDTSPQVTIYSYIPHIMDSPTSQVDSMCSFCNGDRRLSPVRVGTSILLYNPIPSVDKPFWI